MRTELQEILRRDRVVVRREHPSLDSCIGWLLRTGELTAVLPGVAADTARAADFETRVAAVRASDRDAVITGRAAARLTFWPELPAPVVSAAVGHSRSARPGFEFCRRSVPPELVVERGGLRMTCPAMTALDLCSELEGDAIDRALRLRVARLADFEAALATTPSRIGNRQRRRLLLESRAEPWSKAERQAHQLLHRAGITGWRANVGVRIAGSVFFLDIAFEDLRVAVEIDGRAFHGEESFEQDRRRQNLLVLDGWIVLRFTWARLLHEPETVVAEILDALDLARQVRGRRSA